MNVDQSSRPVAADDDGADQIGFDTPRSGVATPQPDLHDRRLPGITSYFGQVRTPSVLGSSPSTVPIRDVSQERQAESAADDGSENVVGASDVSKPTVAFPQPPLSPPSPLHEVRGGSSGSTPSALTAFHGYPTPPTSRCSSVGRLTRSLGRWNGDQGVAAHPPSRPFPRQASTPDILSETYRTTVPCPPSIATTPPVHAAHLSNPAVSTQYATHPSSTHSPASSQLPVVSSIEPCFSLDVLRKLTQVAVVKSGPPTPTRALSSAQPSQSEDKLGSKRSSNETGTSSGTQTPRASGGAQVPAAKGKLTIKIVEARGLRRARDPYVVAVFQRSELISAGPRSVQEDDEEATSPPAVGGIPIQRQGSDSGRPPVSIPMRSRQSSNTSAADYNNFRNRPKRSFTSPKWDAEAAL